MAGRRPNSRLLSVVGSYTGSRSKSRSHRVSTQPLHALCCQILRSGGLSPPTSTWSPPLSPAYASTTPRLMSPPQLMGPIGSERDISPPPLDRSSPTEVNHLLVPEPISPPGFEGVPGFASASQMEGIGNLSHTNAAKGQRRSVRILLKNSGPYLTSVQKAQLNKFKVLEVNKKKKGKTAAAHVKPDYLKETVPITVEQAEIILNEAGLTLTEDLKSQLA